MSVVHKLKVIDHDKKVNYCEWFERFINCHEIQVLDRTFFFTDEAWFHLGSYINSQNTLIWSLKNPRAVRDTISPRKNWSMDCNITNENDWIYFFWGRTVDSEVYCNGVLFNLFPN